MKTKREHKPGKNGENGNVLLYVLVAIVLFAALSFILARQTRHGNTGEIDEAKAEMYAGQLIAYATQAKTVIDQLLVTGSTIDDLNFILPSEAAFNTAPHVHKVYHPAGGGFIPANLAADAQDQTTINPPAGWYMGAFNSVEWTDSTGTDVIITAHQISRRVCEKINIKITGAETIPVLSGDVRSFLIEASVFGGTNDNLEVTDCAACEGYMSLCVSNTAANSFSFYNVIADR